MASSSAFGSKASRPVPSASSISCKPIVKNAGRELLSFAKGVRGITREDLSPKVIVTTSSTTTPVAVCVHCRNLGLNYNHWLRESPEPNSPVVCPVLLATECRYCHAVGHTVSSCPAKMRSGSYSTNNNKSKLKVFDQRSAEFPRNVETKRHEPFAIDGDRNMNPQSSTQGLRSRLVTNPYSVFGTSSDSDSDSVSVSSKTDSSTQSTQHRIKRIDVSSLFATSATVPVPCVAPPHTKRIDVGSLFSPVTITSITTSTRRRPLKLDDDGLHECDYDPSYGDPEVDRMVAERYALFTSGIPWADICADEDSEEE